MEVKDTCLYLLKGAMSQVHHLKTMLTCVSGATLQRRLRHTQLMREQLNLQGLHFL